MSPLTWSYIISWTHMVLFICYLTHLLGVMTLTQLWHHGSKNMGVGWLLGDHVGGPGIRKLGRTNQSVAEEGKSRVWLMLCSIRRRDTLGRSSPLARRWALHRWAWVGKCLDIAGLTWFNTTWTLETAKERQAWVWFPRWQTNVWHSTCSRSIERSMCKGFWEI